MTAAEPAVDMAPWAGQRTARKAVDILLTHDPRHHCPSPAERRVLLQAYAVCGKAVHGAAYDAIRLDRPIDLTDVQAVAANIDAITLCEIKSTARAEIGSDLKGYFFNITASELLTAQSLGERYRFVFVNTLTGEVQEMGLYEVFGRARGMYPAWHIRL